jgi:hypothetical protein
MLLEKFSLAATHWHYGCTRLVKRHEYPAGCGLSTHAPRKQPVGGFQLRNLLEPADCCRKIAITLIDPSSEFERLPRKSIGKRVYELREKRRAADWVRGKANRLPL